MEPKLGVVWWWQSAGTDRFDRWLCQNCDFGKEGGWQLEKLQQDFISMLMFIVSPFGRRLWITSPGWHQGGRGLCPFRHCSQSCELWNYSWIYQDRWQTDSLDSGLDIMLRQLSKATLGKVLSNRVAFKCNALPCLALGVYCLHTGNLKTLCSSPGHNRQKMWSSIWGLFALQVLHFLKWIFWVMTFRAVCSKLLVLLKPAKHRKSRKTAISLHRALKNRTSLHCGRGRNEEGHSTHFLLWWKKQESSMKKVERRALWNFKISLQQACACTLTLVGVYSNHND